MKCDPAGRVYFMKEERSSFRDARTARGSFRLVDECPLWRNSLLFFSERKDPKKGNNGADWNRLQ